MSPTPYPHKLRGFNSTGRKTIFPRNCKLGLGFAGRSGPLSASGAPSVIIECADKSMLLPSSCKSRSGFACCFKSFSQCAICAKCPHSFAETALTAASILSQRHAAAGPREAHWCRSRELQFQAASCQQPSIRPAERALSRRQGSQSLLVPRERCFLFNLSIRNV